VVLVDGIQMLIDNVIVDPTLTNLVLWSDVFRGVVIIIVVQLKDGFYLDQYLVD
jgi:hypothetical protein